MVFCRSPKASHQVNAVELTTPSSKMANTRLDMELRIFMINFRR